MSILSRPPGRGAPLARYSRSSRLGLAWVFVVLGPILMPAAAQTNEGRIVERVSLSSCDYLWTRQLANKLRVTPSTTQSLAVARMRESGQPVSNSILYSRENRIALATGEIHGNPYDAMGVGTLVEVTPQDWVTICGVTFRGGSLDVTERGFEFSPSTEFMAAQATECSADIYKCQELANGGDAEAQTNLGVMYANGEG